MRILFTLLFVTITLTAIAGRKVTVKFNQTKDEVYTKPSLKEYLRDNPKPAILLRVPSSVTSSTKSDGNDLINNPEFYSYIEKTFFRRGFTIRDRAIYDKILTQSRGINYSDMSNLTNTDIVLEIVSIQYQEYHTNEVIKNGEPVVYKQCNFGGFYGWKVDCKIVLVKQNEIADLFTFHKAPCTNGCKFELGHSCNLVSPKVKLKDKDGEPIPWEYKETVGGADLENFATLIANKLISEMK